MACPRNLLHPLRAPEQFSLESPRRRRSTRSVLIYSEGLASTASKGQHHRVAEDVRTVAPGQAEPEGRVAARFPHFPQQTLRSLDFPRRLPDFLDQPKQRPQAKWLASGVPTSVPTATRLSLSWQGSDTLRTPWPCTGFFSPS